jgi:nicotinamidase-related amidase
MGTNYARPQDRTRRHRSAERHCRLPTAHRIDEVVLRASALADVFRHRGLPVVLVNVGGGTPGRTEQTRSRGELPAGWGRSRPQAERAVGRPQGDEAYVGSVHEHGSGGVSEETGCTQVVIAGVATSIGVESTACRTHERGFNVTLAIDAMTDTSPDSHVNSITRKFPKLRNWHDPGNHRSPRGETRDRVGGGRKLHTFGGPKLHTR